MNKNLVGTGSSHIPVLLKRSIDLLKLQDEGTYVDLTLGGGGHTIEILKRLDKVNLICFDQDETSIKRFKSFLKSKKWKEEKGGWFALDSKRIKLINQNFENLLRVLDENDVREVNGILADLGVSSDQLDNPERGFSYTMDGPLDMRMDTSLKVTAADLVNALYQSELEKLFWAQDEKYGRRIAKTIIRERKKKPIKTTKHLINTIQKALPNSFRGKLQNPDRTYVGSFWKKSAMRVFQALRIAVNSEMDSLQSMLPQALEALAADGRLVVISFHSGEDRIVKNKFKVFKEEELAELVNDEIIQPTEEEIDENPRSRSAKLRALKKL